MGEGNASSWASGHNLSHPVLQDNGWQVSDRWELDNGIPSFTVIGRDMTLRTVDAYYQNQDYEQVVYQALGESVPEVEWNEPPAP